MKRKLLRQIINEWHSNVWLALELLIVSVVMWWLCDQLWVSESTYREPLGFDYSHCYRISVAELNPKSPDYREYQDEEARTADRLTLVRRLEARPEIEAAGIGITSYFYNNSNSGTRLSIDTLQSSNFVVLRRVSPGFIRVFRISGAGGETPEQLAEILEKSPGSAFMASDNLFRFKYGIESIADYVGRDFHEDNDSTPVRLAAVYKPLRYSDFNSNRENMSSAIFPLTRGSLKYADETVVRVKDNMDRNFTESLMADANGSLRVGNWYISSVDSFDSIRRNFIRDDTQTRINHLAGSLFLLVNIFLGVLGTFWFRTSLRTGEIGLRIANGATRTDIFRRVISEGEILLLAVTPIAGVIDWMLTRYELNAWYSEYFEPVRFFGCMAIVWALIALMIAVGSWIPARRAMRTSPAEALKCEA